MTEPKAYERFVSTLRQCTLKLSGTISQISGN